LKDTARVDNSAWDIAMIVVLNFESHILMVPDLKTETVTL